jgi:hypothetical protein
MPGTALAQRCVQCKATTGKVMAQAAKKDMDAAALPKIQLARGSCRDHLELLERVVRDTGSQCIRRSK